jgi:hypothetical protein
MATIVFTALGTLLGGPLGGALGAFAGRQVDGLIFGSPSRDGPRLKDLTVTSSSYGTPIARHYGRMRVAGSVIWSTDLVEHAQTHGGKGQPSVTTYSYSASFAVALASREITNLGRIWADGNLLRGSAGDLKVGGSMRVYNGSRDQNADPLIAAAEGAETCPAYRGIAYVVFEDLQLEEFGNRIPALTFEVLADSEPLSLGLLFAESLDEIDADLDLPGLAGLSCEGQLGLVLEQLDPVFPMDCDATADALTIAPARLQGQPLALGEAAISARDEDFGAASGFHRRRAGPTQNPPAALRYYDLDRDYQPGMQRAPGRPAPGEPATIELPAALAASDARELIAGAAKRSVLGRETLSWRTGEIDAAVRPGAVVTVPGQAGQWRVADWEWRESGVELSLVRLPPPALAAAVPGGGDSGRVNLPGDLLLTPTYLAAGELPWDGAGSGQVANIFAAVSSSGAGWKGAALYADKGDGQLVPLGSSGRRRAVIGTAIDALPVASPLVLDRAGSVTVELVGADMVLTDASLAQLATGTNRALLGGELIQYGRAVPLGGGRWRLDQLLRGRGGTEHATAGHQPGESFVLLGGELVAVDPALVGTSPTAQIAALGLADTAPVLSPIINRGITLRPLCPVHPEARSESGALRLGWTRRARGAWLWLDGVETPLVEQSELYEVVLGPLDAPLARWETSETTLVLSAAILADLAASHPGAPLQVRQIGTHARSPALHLANLP